MSPTLVTTAMPTVMARALPLGVGPRTSADQRFAWSPPRIAMIPPSATSPAPTSWESPASGSWSTTSGCSRASICSSTLSLAMATPKPMKATAVRTQASRVRSLAMWSRAQDPGLAAVWAGWAPSLTAQRL